MNKDYANLMEMTKKTGLDQFKALEYDTWAKVLNRVNRC